jgi:hypothetical protein
MKKAKPILFPLGIIVILIAFQFCNRNEPIRNNEIFPDKILISAVSYNKFVASYNEFFGNLTQHNKDMIDQFIKSNYVEAKAKLNTGGRVSKAECNCSPGQATCSSESWASDCCICCEAGKSAVCGSYFGISSCKCDGAAEGPSDGRTIGESGDMAEVNIYPNRFFEIFAFAEKKSVNVDEIREKLRVTLKKQ